MRPINLLPEKDRPRGPSGGRQGGAYGVLGVLGVLLLGLVMYVMTVNGINSKKDELTRAQNEAQQAEAQAAALGSYGSFSGVKETRVASVRSLASVRFDWERLTRELAHVLPDDVWVTNLEASTTPAQQAGIASTDLPTGPTLKLSGCAKTQPHVATAMVRLRRLHRAEDVKLVESSRQSGGSAGASAPPPSGAGGAAAGGCPNEGKDRYFQFQAQVEFSEIAAPEGPGAGRVPVTLGGGS